MKGIGGTSTAGRGLLLSANRGVPLAVYGNEFALAHGLGGSADGGWTCVRYLDGAGNVQENQPQDVLAPSTSTQWDAASNSG